MAVPNPNHFFEQAGRLIASPLAGRPRQVDLRRAISAAYYGVFHAILAAAADQVVGVTKRTTSQYALVYRSIDHKTVREVCAEIKKQKVGAKYARYEPRNGFGPNIKAFAAAVLELQEKRHAADYDPSIRENSSDAILAVSTARTALRRFAHASAGRRKAFLGLLLFQPR